MSNQQHSPDSSPDMSAYELVPTGDGSQTLKHPGHGECYHSWDGAKAESVELYLVGSGLQQRFQSFKGSVVVADIGLGLGYNALTILEAWFKQQHPPALHMVSFEHDAKLFDAFRSGEASWQQPWSPLWCDLAQGLQACTKGGEFREKFNVEVWAQTIAHPKNAHTSCSWTVLRGEAETALANLGAIMPELAAFDVVCQDPFSPTKNPSLWSTDWFTRLKHRSHHDATLVTYSVARAVKDALTSADWSWEKTSGSGRKRHWLKAKPNVAPSSKASDQEPEQEPKGV